MKRLTRKIGSRYGTIEECELNTIKGARAVVDRLAAYEDTGLEPEEITALRSTLEEYHKEADPLLRAKVEDRLVVLPCKVGGTVWFRTYTKNGTVDLGFQPHEVCAVRTYLIVPGEFSSVGLPVDHFGKTVFLTREEAEKETRAAMPGGGGDG